MVKRTVVLIVALVLAGIAAFSIWQYLQGVDEDAREGLQLVPVYRASQDIPARTPGNSVISEDLFTESEESFDFLPGETPAETVAFSSAEELDECTNAGGELEQREDDNEEVIGNRLSVYRTQTEPLVEFYRQQGKLKTVDADGAIDAVYERFLQQIQ